MFWYVVLLCCEVCNYCSCFVSFVCLFLIQGSIGYKNSRRGTSFAAQSVGQAAAQKARDLGIRKVRVQLKGLGIGRQVKSSKLKKMRFIHFTNNIHESDGTVTNDRVVADTVTDDRVADDTVTNDRVTDDTVTNDRVTDDMVTNDRVADDMVTNDRVADDMVTNDRVADDTVTNDRVADETH